MKSDEINDIEKHFDDLIAMQRDKVLNLARRLNPVLTNDDVLSPHDFPELTRSADFQFEDGILSGLIQAQISLRVGFFRKENEETDAKS